MNNNEQFGYWYQTAFRAEYNRMCADYRNKTGGEPCPITFEEWMAEQINFEAARQDAERVWNEQHDRIVELDSARREEKDRADRLQRQVDALEHRVTYLQKEVEDYEEQEDNDGMELALAESDVSRLRREVDAMEEFLHSIGVDIHHVVTYGDLERAIEAVAHKFGYTRNPGS